MNSLKTIIGIVGFLGIVGCSSPCGKPSTTIAETEVHWITNSAAADATDVEADYIDTLDSEIETLLFRAVDPTRRKLLGVERVSEWLVFTYPPKVGVNEAKSRKEVISTPFLMAKDTKLSPNPDKLVETGYVFARGVEPGATAVAASYTVLLRLNELGVPSRFVKVQVTGYYEAKKWKFRRVGLVE